MFTFGQHRASLTLSNTFGDINVVDHLKGNDPQTKQTFGAARYAVLKDGQRQVKKDGAALSKFHKRLFKAGRVAEPG